jgi:hypothetical protein
MTNFCIDVGQSAVGGIGIRIGQDVHRYVAELGFWLGEEFWGHGIMTEVIPPFVDHCFENFALYRIYAEPYANNPASARVLEKAGFILEGDLRTTHLRTVSSWIHFSTPKHKIASLSRSISILYRCGHDWFRGAAGTVIATIFPHDFVYRSRLQRRTRAVIDYCGD